MARAASSFCWRDSEEPDWECRAVAGGRRTAQAPPMADRADALCVQKEAAKERELARSKRSGRDRAGTGPGESCQVSILIAGYMLLPTVEYR
mmetsp:Transcript_12610/g.25236  ORF Transcript_12610/g.25236 Transcript_12610/m.25236 type:complete len:92 (+) Transcript_12610:510-785(+)